MHAWEFPDELVCCVYFHHRGIEILKDERLNKTAAAAVAISSLLPDALRQEVDGLEKLIKLADFVEASDFAAYPFEILGINCANQTCTAWPIQS